MEYILQKETSKKLHLIFGNENYAMVQTLWCFKNI